MPYTVTIPLLGVRLGEIKQRPGRRHVEGLPSWLHPNAEMGRVSTQTAQQAKAVTRDTHSNTDTPLQHRVEQNGRNSKNHRIFHKSQVF